MILSLLCGISTGRNHSRYDVYIPYPEFSFLISFFLFLLKKLFFLLHTPFLFLFIPCLKYLFIVYFSATLQCFEMMMSLYKWVWQWGYLRNSLKIFVYLLRVKVRKQASKLDKLIWQPLLNAPLLPHLCVTHFQSLNLEGSRCSQSSGLRSGEEVVHSTETGLIQCALCSQSSSKRSRVLPGISHGRFMYSIPLPGDSCTGTFRV